MLNILPTLNKVTIIIIIIIILWFRKDTASSFGGKMYGVLMKETLRMSG